MEKKFLSKTGLIALKDILDKRFQKKFEFVEGLPDVSTSDSDTVYVVKVISSKDSIDALKGYVIIDSNWKLLFDSSAISNTKGLLTTDEFNTVIEQVYLSIDESKEATKELKEALKEFAYAEVGEKKDIPEGTEPVQLYQPEESEHKYPYVDLGSYSTKEELTTVKQTADYAKEKINGLQIGGRNLFLNSNFDNSGKWKIYQNSELSVKDNIATMTIGAPANTGFSSGILYSDNYLDYKAGEYFTISGEVRSDTITKAFYNYIIAYPITGANLDLHITIDVSPDWTKFQSTFIINSDIHGGLGLGVYQKEIEGQSIQFRKLKLERGNVATDWTPAPEDTALDIGNSTQSTDISKIPVTHRLCVIDTNTGGTFNLANTMLNGQELHVIVNNTSDSSIVIAIPTSFKTDIDSLEIDANSFGEINVICQGTNRYLRAIS